VPRVLKPGERRGILHINPRRSYTGYISLSLSYNFFVFFITGKKYRSELSSVSFAYLFLLQLTVTNLLL